MGYEAITGAPMIPSVSILIRTYWLDFPWLRYCLRSVEKFASGFCEVVVVGPDDSYAGQIAKECSEHGARFVEGVKEPVGKGNLAAQFYAMSADLICNGDQILFMDSDCTFNACVTPSTFRPVENPELPYLCVRPWLASRKEERLAWRATTDKVMKSVTEFNGMTRHPAVHHRWLLPRFRGYIEEKHRMKFDEYVLSRKADFPQGISEFNALASFARAFYFDDYTWVDVSVVKEPPTFLTQHWSHGGHSGGIKPEILDTFAKLGLKD